MDQDELIYLCRSSLPLNKVKPLCPVLLFQVFLLFHHRWLWGKFPLLIWHHSISCKFIVMDTFVQDERIREKTFLLMVPLFAIAGLIWSILYYYFGAKTSA